jgi:hypothetical protein
MEMFLYTFLGIIILLVLSNYFDNQSKKNSQYNSYFENDLREFCDKNNYSLNKLYRNNKMKHICFIKYKNGKKICCPLYQFNEYNEQHRYLANELKKGEVLQYKIIDKPINFKIPDPLYTPD